MTLTVLMTEGKSKNWCAEIVGFDERYKYKRQFLNSEPDGDRVSYELQNKKIYQINRSGHKQFVTPDGERLVELSEQEVKAALLTL